MEISYLRHEKEEAASRPCLPAPGAGTSQPQFGLGDAEIPYLGHSAPQVPDNITIKFHHPSTLHANNVMVTAASLHLVVMVAIIKVVFSNQAALFEPLQDTVNGGQADARLPPAGAPVNLVGIQVRGPLPYYVQHQGTLAGGPQPPGYKLPAALLGTAVSRLRHACTSAKPDANASY